MILVLILIINNLQGDIKEQEAMEKILKEHEIEIVISVVGGKAILHQLGLVHAIKSVGTVKVAKLISFNL